MKYMTIDQFLTKEEIERCAELYRQLSNTGRFAATVDQEIIKPNLGRINKALGQENDSRYLAYCVEYVMMYLDATSASRT